MSEDKELGSEIPAFVKKYVPAVNRGLAWAKYGKEKFDIIKKMDILFYPTFNDAYPLVLLECLQIGMPVVASNQGAIPEIIDKNTGFIFETGQLGDALICILKVI